RYSKEKGGTGGLVPLQYLFAICRLCRREGIDLPLEEMVFSPEERAELSALSQTAGVGSPRNAHANCGVVK
ncbi:MAG: hypothetical protein ABJJ15_03870, partial [Roseibium sp.]